MYVLFTPMMPASIIKIHYCVNVTLSCLVQRNHFAQFCYTRCLWIQMSATYKLLVLHVLSMSISKQFVMFYVMYSDVHSMLNPCQRTFLTSILSHPQWYIIWILMTLIFFIHNMTFKFTFKCEHIQFEQVALLSFKLKTALFYQRKHYTAGPCITVYTCLSIVVTTKITITALLILFMHII